MDDPASGGVFRTNAATNLQGIEHEAICARRGLLCDERGGTVAIARRERNVDPVADHSNPGKRLVEAGGAVSTNEGGGGDGAAGDGVESRK